MPTGSSLEKQIDICVSCLTCTTVCPVFKASGDEATLTNAPPGFFKGYRYLREWGIDQDVEELGQSLFDCRTCGACEQVCSMVLKVTSMVLALRERYWQEVVNKKFLPGRLKAALDNSNKYGNPYGQSSWNRNAWFKELGTRKLSQRSKTEFLYFIGCRDDEWNWRIVGATTRVLQKRDVDFGTMGDAEPCCGNVALTLGNRALFEWLAMKTIQDFRDLEVRKVLCNSPHCYNTLKNAYPRLGSDFEVQHISEFLAGMIADNKLRFSKPLPKIVTYHDPCYLGRHSGIYESPRMVLKAIPDLRLIEMEMSRSNSLCCGGAGLEEWQCRDLERRIAIRRVKQAKATGAEVIVTSCPSCVKMLEEALTTLGLHKKITVRDLTEIVEEAL